jgi:hypothetical protein
MAIIIDATPAGPNANSYLTLAEANAYYAGHSHPEHWDDADDDEARNRALVTATRLLDEHLEYDGYVATATQRLLWPRGGLLGVTGYALESDVVPERVKQATAEYARFLLQSDRTGERDDELDAIAELKAGPVEVKFLENEASSRRTVPDEVLAMLRLWTTAQPGRDVTAKLLRT